MGHDRLPDILQILCYKPYLVPCSFPVRTEGFVLDEEFAQLQDRALGILSQAYQFLFLACGGTVDDRVGVVDFVGELFDRGVEGVHCRMALSAWSLGITCEV